MDDNYVMSTSVLQYLEDIRTFMRESNAARPDDKFCLFTTDKNYEESVNSIQFEQPNIYSNSEFNQNDLDRIDQLSLFANKTTMKENEADKDQRDKSMCLSDEEIKNHDHHKVHSNINDSKNLNIDEDGIMFKTPALTGKERARKARQRKKIYYEDLEKRVELLEKKVFDLNKELEFGKQKLRVYEGQRSSIAPNSDVGIKTGLIDEGLKYMNTLPDTPEFMSTGNKITDSHGPFGSETVKILDTAFESILENMLSGGTKLQFYMLNKGMPTTPTEYENYFKLKKFEKFEKYPDPFVRNWLDTMHCHILNKDQIEHYFTNSLHKVVEIKEMLNKGATILLKARDQIFKALMMNDLLKRKFQRKLLNKEQYLTILKNIRDGEMKIGYEQIFKVEKQKIDVDVTLEIADLEKYQKAYEDISHISPIENNFVSHTYSVTTIKGL